MLLSFEVVHQRLKDILINTGFQPQKARLCAAIFTENSRDGVHSHGLNRFPVFVQYIKEGLIQANAEPELTGQTGLVEHWDGHLAPGMYNATICTDRAVALAKANGVGCVTLKNTNHWMRGGTYGWQAAEKGCIAICATNATANMPAWGGVHPTLGNNPLVIAVPRPQGHIVLDMALSQFSYGKLQEYELSGRPLPVAGGYDENGNLTENPAAIRNTQRTLPVGYWKGSGLSMIIDLLVAGLSGGRSVAQITKGGKEVGVSQFFLCLDASNLSGAIVEEIIEFTKATGMVQEGGAVRYPGEQTLATRKKSEQEGIQVNKAIWQEIISLG
jgi:3-dehydro-L-gulonate 2-dehydrogenase